MTNEDAIKWLDNLRQDIGQLRHSDLWHYEQAIEEIMELMKEQEVIFRCKDCKHFDGLDCKVNDIVNIMDTDWFCADGERRE